MEIQRAPVLLSVKLNKINVFDNLQLQKRNFSMLKTYNVLIHLENGLTIIGSGITGSYTRKNGGGKNNLPKVNKKPNSPGCTLI